MASRSNTTCRGTGEPMLFIMGLAGQLIDWPDDFVDPFVEAGFQVIRFDNRDSGLSSKTAWAPPSRGAIVRAFLTRRAVGGVGYTVPDMADDAAGLLDALGVGPAHVVGASMGGMIAQELAIRHPAKVRSLCSIMSNTGDRKHGSIAASLAAHFARQRPAATVVPADAVDAAVDLIAAVSGPHFDRARAQVAAQASVARSLTPDGVARQTAAIAGSRDRTRLLGSVQVPTLVIHGLVDRLIRPSGGIATARAVPGARLLAFPDMGHDLPRPRWPEIRDAIVTNAHRVHVVAAK